MKIYRNRHNKPDTIIGTAISGDAIALKTEVFRNLRETRRYNAAYIYIYIYIHACMHAYTDLFPYYRIGEIRCRIYTDIRHIKALRRM
jgi:hypothetical protein